MKYKTVSHTIVLILLMIAAVLSPAPTFATSSLIIWSEEGYISDPIEWAYDPILDINITWLVPDLDLHPSVMATKENTVWLAWETDATGNNEISYKVYDQGWGDDFRLTYNASDDIAPSIIQASDNKIWIFWSSKRTDNYEIFYKNTTDNGFSWSTETRITNDSRHDSNPAVFQAKDGKIWVVWSRAINSTRTDILYKTFNGISWSNEVPLVTSLSKDQFPAIIQTSDGTIWVFWSSNRTDPYTQVFYKKSTDNGFSWSSETPLTTEEKTNIDPTAFQEEDGTIWVFWSSKEQTMQATFDLWFKTSTDNGSTWSSPVQFTTHSDEDFYPSATKSRDKSIWVFWISTRPDPVFDVPSVDIYYKVTLLGDIDKNGIIDITDLGIIAKAMGTDPNNWPHGTDWDQWNPECDLNLDNKVNVLDLAIAGVNYGRSA